MTDTQSQPSAKPEVPSASDFTSSPLRNRIRVELDAPVPEVWELVGDLGGAQCSTLRLAWRPDDAWALGAPATPKSTVSETAKTTPYRRMKKTPLAAVPAPS